MRMSWVVCILVISAGMTSAVTINVPGEFSTIQAAIDRADIGDTVLVADGTYSGTGNVNLDFSGKDFVLISENGPHNTIIDCQFSGRAFYFHSGETSAAEINGFTITSGFEVAGGGVYITDAAPTFKYCIVKSCQSATAGGGICVFQGTPSFIKCVLHDNYASEGGAMSAEFSDVTVNSCVVAANTSSG